MNPCRHCEKRHQSCHTNCLDYDNWLEVVKKARDARKREREVNEYIFRPVPGKRRKVR